MNFKEHGISCDGCFKKFYFTSTSLKEVRHKAKLKGWIYSRGVRVDSYAFMQGQDWCSICLKGKNKPKERDGGGY